MIPIAIYENDKTFSAWMEQVIRQYTHFPTSMNTGKVEEMKAFIRSRNESVLYFLDIIDEGKENEAVGIELAEEIIRHQPNGLIAFVSAYPSSIQYNTRLKAHSFVTIRKHTKYIKDEVEETIHLAENYFDDKALHLSGRFEHIHIPYKEICLIESVPKVEKKLQITGLYGTYIVKNTITKIQSELDERFLQVSQSYIVNKDHVRKVDVKNKTLLLVNGSQCSFSRMYQKSVYRFL